ncbi:MAG: PLP-dependent aminotransferase family protein [Candidatus Eremiobacteraeota bacterium]|nr:PLP-dependent aminotransferase family protein [Candidatus Eremiobacteraeota bacterium]
MLAREGGSLAEPADVRSLFPDLKSRVPVARQLIHNFREAIRSGVLAEGSRLLPTRELAARIGISRNTVVVAIDQLVAEGYLVTRVGSGTFVARGVAAPPKPRAAVPLRLPPAAQRYLNVAPLVAPWPGKLVPFRVGCPDLTAFPLTAWERLAHRSRTLVSRYSYGDRAGLPRLRGTLAEHLRQSRGLAVRPEDIVVVDGAQSALSLIADVLLETGDRVLLEDPCYFAARAAFGAHGATIVPVAVDDDGLDARSAPPAKLTYLTPSHHYPLGGTMSPERRDVALAWAHRNDAYIIEDDYDGEFHFGSRPLPAMQGGDDEGRVIYVGTFSKVLAPGLRLGFLVSPPHLTEAFQAARAVRSLGTSAHAQLILADFIAEGYLARHVRRMTAEYKRRMKTLAELLQPLSDMLTVGPVTGGMHLTVRATQPLDDVAVARVALENGLSLYALSDECIARTDLRGFVLGVGMAPCDAMPLAIDSLAASLAAVT